MPAIRRVLKGSAIAAGVLALAVAAWDVATYDGEAWLADFGRLKQDMAQGYANLDWMVEHRGLDLVAMDRRTTAELENAHSRLRAFLALRRFVRGFEDPHFRLKPGERPVPAPMTAQAVAETSSISQQEPVDAPAGADCASAGYEEGDHVIRFPFAAMRGWTQLRDGDFPTGMVGDTGVLRIAQFGEDQYLAACQAVFKPGMGERELQLAVRARQQALLAETIAELRKRGAKRLLVDVSGNGGGTEWVSEVIELMTDKALARREARIVGPACDRTAVWSGGKAPCSVFEPGSGERATLQGNGTWRGPVVILADRGTGSAAEDFVAWLQQNKVATVIGDRTAGAGCGYVNGGNPTRLAVVPVDVWMPNCARLLDDGTNEVEGIAPDVSLPMGDGADQAAQANALAGFLARG
jgi:hypothetical protein